VSLALPVLVTTLGAAACLAACGADTVSAPTVSTPQGATVTATPTATAAITGSPTPPPATATATPAATPAPAVSTSGPAGQTMALDPGTVPAGSAVRISGYALSCTGVTLLSNAFPGPQELAGVHAVSATSTADGHFSATVTIPSSTPPGGYAVTARACGGNLGVQLTLKVTAA
jgi:hypothetical protein